MLRGVTGLIGNMKAMEICLKALKTIIVCQPLTVSYRVLYLDSHVLTQSAQRVVISHETFVCLGLSSPTGLKEIGGEGGFLLGKKR